MEEGLESALLWHRLMGKKVLAVNQTGSPFLRVYAHCSKGMTGVTLLLINLSNTTEFDVTVRNEMNLNLQWGEDVQEGGSFLTNLKKTFAWIGRKASDTTDQRKEYHLTPKDGNLRSQIMLLNGIPLELNADESIPDLDPVMVDVNSPIVVAPLSIAFASFPKFEVAACV
ncbi:hypothetical protein ACLOJK_038459 [Asimina triloba]